MSFLGKGKKVDLMKLAIELNEVNGDEDLKIVELKSKILESDAYEEDPDFVKGIFEGIVADRVDEEIKQKEQAQRDFELQKIRLQNTAQGVAGPQAPAQTRIELKKLLPTFNPECDNMDLFLTLFERQMKFLDIGEELWVPYLIGSLPSEVTTLIAREPEEKCKNYCHIRGMLLQRFKLTAEKFRELFSRHRKSPNGTWKDFYFEIRAYFEGWLSELKITTFEGLQNLIIADQMKKRCSPESKEHYLDIWEELISPEVLAEKLESFDNIRRSLPPETKRPVKGTEALKDAHPNNSKKPDRFPKRDHPRVPDERPPLKCYGCGKPGVIKAKCSTCNPSSSRREDIITNHVKAYAIKTKTPRITLVDITFCGQLGRVCADTGSSHSIAGSKMYQVFQDNGLTFHETHLTMSLADGKQTVVEALSTQVMVHIEGRSILTKFIILPEAKGNRTLLGTDFLSSAGIVLDVKNHCWYFCDNPDHKYPFGEELDTPSTTEQISSNTCQLREEERKYLEPDQRKKLNSLLGSYQSIFEPGGDSTPISVPPYRMSPIKREVVEEQDNRKPYADRKRKPSQNYQPGEHVLVMSHPLSKTSQGRSAKLMPRRDGPYVILTQRSASSYEIASLDDPEVPLGVYHTSALTPCTTSNVSPTNPLRKRGRPPKVRKNPGSSSGRRRSQRGRM